MFTFLAVPGCKVPIDEMLAFMQDVAHVSAFMQMLFLVLVLFAGAPGVYVDGTGMMFISDNFCTKTATATLFMLSTLPTWVLLACSVALESNPHIRRLLIWVISIPLPVGIGIVLFSLCKTPTLHYVYVNIFVASVGFVHLAVAYTALHVQFLQTYYGLLVCTALCAACFVVLALFEHTPSTERNVAVILEYLAVAGFIILNGFTTDRVREHMYRHDKPDNTYV